MFRPIDIDKLQSMQARADRVRSMIHERAIAEFHLAFGHQAKPGDHLDMCVIHNSILCLEEGKPWREVNYAHMRKAAWLCERSYKPSEIVRAWYARNTRSV